MTTITWQKPTGSKVWHRFAKTSKGVWLSSCGSIAIHQNLRQNQLPSGKRCKNCG